MKMVMYHSNLLIIAVASAIIQYIILMILQNLQKTLWQLYFKSAFLDSKVLNDWQFLFYGRLAEDNRAAINRSFYVFCFL